MTKRSGSGTVDKEWRQTQQLNIQLNVNSRYIVARVT